MPTHCVGPGQILVLPLLAEPQIDAGGDDQNDSVDRGLQIKYYPILNLTFC